MLSAHSSISDLEQAVGDGGIAARQQIAANRAECSGARQRPHAAAADSGSGAGLVWG